MSYFGLDKDFNIVTHLAPYNVQWNRRYYETGDCKYLHAAQKAIDFMLKPINKGGTTQYTSSGDIFFYVLLKNMYNY